MSRFGLSYRSLAGPTRVAHLSFAPRDGLAVWVFHSQAHRVSEPRVYEALYPPNTSLSWVGGQNLPRT